MDPDPRCVACGRRLRTADSIRAGIGPTCRTRRTTQVTHMPRLSLEDITARSHPAVPGQLALDEQETF